MITELTTYRLIKELLILEQKLDEGLIMTYDIKSSVKSINNIFDINTIENIQIIKNKIHITLNNNDKTINVDKFSLFLLQLTTLGYYIAKLTMYNQYNNPYTMDFEKFKYKYFSDDILSNITKYEIIIEPKFDIKHKLKTNILYHVTETKYLDKILKNGLIAKSMNTLSNYPERLYLVYNLEDAETYIKTKKGYYLKNIDKSIQPDKSKFQNIEYSILKIELPENNDFIFYDDPNFENKGIYTYDNISPNYITQL